MKYGLRYYVRSNYIKTTVYESNASFYCISIYSRERNRTSEQYSQVTDSQFKV